MPAETNRRTAIARIHLVRHGPSALVHDGRWMRARGVRDYEEEYDAAGILDEAPPDSLVALARQAGVLVASDMPRAIASARRLAQPSRLTILPLLRELQLEPPTWLPLKLPIQAWDTISYLQWSIRLSRRTDHPIARRADEAAEWLTTRASGGVSVVAVTHGGIRRIIARCLEQRGWIADDSQQGYQNWSYWSYALART